MQKNQFEKKIRFLTTIYKTEKKKHMKTVSVW